MAERRSCGDFCSDMWLSSLYDLKTPRLYKALAAEFIGTLFIVLIGCGTCIGKDWESYHPSVVQISLAFGLVVAAVVYCFSHISGGHFNPAVTAAMLVTRKISFTRAVLYVLVQCCGAAVGAAFLAGLTPTDVQEYLGMTTINSSISVMEGFSVEILITFLLVLTIFAACDKYRSDLGGNKALMIGLVVSLCHLFAIKYTGSSMNPARSFGPALVMNSWHDYYWVYWCGPLLGGVLAGLVYEMLFSQNSSMEKIRKYFECIPKSVGTYEEDLPYRVHHRNPEYIGVKETEIKEPLPTDHLIHK